MTALASRYIMDGSIHPLLVYLSFGRQIHSTDFKKLSRTRIYSKAGHNASFLSSFREKIEKQETPDTNEN
jgi:hypothetical protein